MGYTKKDWEARLAERTDLSTSIVHLTKIPDDDTVFIDHIIKILLEGKLVGSTTSSGFIVGNIPAVCFQDTPMNSISQNIWFEQKYRELTKSTKVRYLASGFAFSKGYAYTKGVRPVIYEETSIAKKLLHEDEHWRIVNFNLRNADSIIDWTHEREWRCPNEFKFDISEVTLLLTKKELYREFMEQCEEEKLDLHKKIKGIIVMRELLF